MMTQLEQAMNGLIKAGDGVWDQIKEDGAEMAMSLVQDMRDAQAKMMIDLSQEVSGDHKSTSPGLTISYGLPCLIWGLK
jgi:hypothetical protein